MNDFLKLAIAAPFIGFCIASVVFWINGAFDWGDVCFPILAAIAFLPVRWAFSRTNRQPDFLAQLVGGPGYFERRGFCFVISPGQSETHAFLDIHFQNRFAKPCLGTILLLATEGFFLTRPRLKIPPISIDCPGGAFGFARVCYAVPKEYQGTKFSFDVFASAKYPRGRGKRLRFTEACHVGSAGFDVWSIFTAIGALGGAIVLTKPARIQFLLPSNVCDSIDDGPPTALQILWRLGDAQYSEGAENIR